MTGLFFVLILSLIAGFLGSLVLRIAVVVEKKVTGSTENYDLLLAYCRIMKAEHILLDDAKKNRLNLIINFAYNSVFGIFIPLVVSLLVPATIISSSAGVAFIYLVLLMVVYFIIVHIINLALLSFVLNKENPFWKWGIKSNLIEALKRFVFSIASVFAYLCLSMAYLFVVL